MLHWNDETMTFCERLVQRKRQVNLEKYTLSCRHHEKWTPLLTAVREMSRHSPHPPPPGHGGRGMKDRTQENDGNRVYIKRSKILNNLLCGRRGGLTVRTLDSRSVPSQSSILFWPIIKYQGLSLILKHFPQ